MLLRKIIDAVALSASAPLRWPAWRACAQPHPGRRQLRSPPRNERPGGVGFGHTTYASWAVQHGRPEVLWRLRAYSLRESENPLAAASRRRLQPSPTSLSKRPASTYVNDKTLQVSGRVRYTPALPHWTLVGAYYTITEAYGTGANAGCGTKQSGTVAHGGCHLVRWPTIA